MKCDRCGKTYVTNHHKYVEQDGDHTLTGMYFTRFGEEPSRHIDLCDDCLNDLCAFIDDEAYVVRYDYNQYRSGKGETYKGEFDNELE